MSYAGLCYHYIRNRTNEFPKIKGTDVDTFRDHLTMLKRGYQVISAEEATGFSCGNSELDNGVLITFDDGLSDHYQAACMLHECGIQGIFFIPTCLLEERIPITPVIIHYCLAEFGIERFLQSYRESLEYHGLPIDVHNIKYHDPPSTIPEIKFKFKYGLDRKVSRGIIIDIYKKLFLDQYPDAFEIMHLTSKQIKGMIDMGHCIGSHSHSHVSLASTDLSSQELNAETVYSKRCLESEFGVRVTTFSYPFGEKQDCCFESFEKDSMGYDLAFTADGTLNTKDVSSFRLGRHLPWGTEDSSQLNKNLQGIFR